MSYIFIQFQTLRMIDYILEWIQKPPNLMIEKGPKKLEPIVK